MSDIKQMKTKHLDLGCGAYPRNPLNADSLFGIDIDPTVEKHGENFKCVNLVIDPLPFEQNFFDSVSAFDVIEHIPRQAVDYANRLVRLPFIELMDEIHRVLKPGGVFYALTPAVPSAEAFQDPTHVNFISDETHNYFCGPDGYAKNYGFKGEFKALEIRRVYPKYAMTAERNTMLNLKNWHKCAIKGEGSHLIWQLEAIK